MHVVSVGIVANHRQHFSLHAFGMEHDGTLPRAGKSKLTLKELALQGWVAAAPDIVEADFADDGGRFQPGQHGGPAAGGGVPGMDAAGAVHTGVARGKSRSLLTLLGRGTAEHGAHRHRCQQLFGKRRKMAVGVTEHGGWPPSAVCRCRCGARPGRRAIRGCAAAR